MSLPSTLKPQSHWGYLYTITTTYKCMRLFLLKGSSIDQQLMIPSTAIVKTTQVLSPPPLSPLNIMALCWPCPLVLYVWLMSLLCLFSLLCWLTLCVYLGGINLSLLSLYCLLCPGPEPQLYDVHYSPGDGAVGCPEEYDEVGQGDQMICIHCSVMCMWSSCSVPHRPLVHTAAPSPGPGLNSPCTHTHPTIILLSG